MSKSDGKQMIYLLITFFAVIILLIILSMCEEVNGAERRTVSLRDFSGGLNTNTNPFLLKQNEFLQLHNFDITDEFGSISLRRGFTAKTDSFPRPTGSDSINITLYVINRVPGPLPPRWPLGEEFLICSLQSADYDLNVGGLWDLSTILIKGSSPDTETVVANFNPTFTGEGDAKFTGITVFDSTKFDVGDSLYMALDTGVAFIDTGNVTGLYAYLDRSGRKFLMEITPGFASGGRWSALMVSQQSKYQPSVRLWPYIHKDETPIWETWKSHVFIALPRQRPLVYDGTRTVPLIPRAPGQLEITPVFTANSTWKINGLVRYTLLQMLSGAGSVVYTNDSLLESDADGTSFTATRTGYVSHEIELDNEHALLFGFPKAAPDTLSVMDIDSIMYYVCRTRGKPFAGEQSFDSFFVVDSIRLAVASIEADTLIIIDSIPDDSLGHPGWPFIGGHRGIIPFDTAFVDSVTKRNDSAFAINGHFVAPGGPTFISHDTGSAGANATWWQDSQDENDSTLVVGVVYFTTLLDTLNGAISDSSPNLWVALAKPNQGTTSDSTKEIKLGIPTLTARDSGLVRILWRSRVLISQVEELSYEVGDSVYINIDFKQVRDGIAGRGSDERTIRITDLDIQTFTRPTGLTEQELSELKRGESQVGGVKGRVVGPRRARRGIPFAAYLITDPARDTITDTLQWAELMGASASFRTTVGSGTWSPLDNRVNIFNGFYAFGDKLYGWYGSRLYMSALDTAFIFRPFQDVAFNLDDGDEVVQVVSIGHKLLVLKNRSMIEMYDLFNGIPTKSAQHDGIGCVAPHSLVSEKGSVIFLSEHGVVSLKASQFQPFGIQTGIISHKINDLILGRPGNKRSAADLKKAVGALVDDKYLLSFPVNSDPSDDTTFVYHIPLNAWSTYDFSFHQATKYDTFTVEGLVQSNRLLFARNDDERIFEFGGSNFYLDSGDANLAITGVFETRPLFTDNDYWGIRDVVMYRSSGNGFVGDNTHVIIMNENATRIDSVDMSLHSDTAAQRNSFGPNFFTWATLQFRTDDPSWKDSLRIHGLDVTARKRGRLLLR